MNKGTVKKRTSKSAVRDDMVYRLYTSANKAFDESQIVVMSQKHQTALIRIAREKNNKKFMYALTNALCVQHMFRLAGKDTYFSHGDDSIKLLINADTPIPEESVQKFTMGDIKKALSSFH
jgi:hypothetical protein